MKKKSPKHWLVKQEPDGYPWSQFVEDGFTEWTGVRNHQAKANLKAMQPGDHVFYYHSNIGKEIVGTAEVTREAASDPTAKEGAWISVELRPLKALPRPVGLAEIKSDSQLADIALVKQSRLSVMPITKKQWDRVLALAKKPRA